MNLKPHIIFELVCQATGIKMREIMSDSRVPNVVTARAMVVYFLRLKLTWTFSRISKAIEKTNCYDLFKKIEFEKNIYKDIQVTINLINSNIEIQEEEFNNKIIKFLRK